MNKYVEQLIADIYAAQNREQEELKTDSIHSIDPGSFFSEDKKLFEQIFEKTCGISKNQFPDSELLTEAQMEGLCEAIERLLFSWNLNTDLPDTLPAEQAYKLLVGVFDLSVLVDSIEQTDIEFCENTPEKCVFGEFCECKKIDEVIAMREKKLGTRILKILSAIRNAPRNLPDPAVFALIYPEVHFLSEPVGPLKSVREWLGLPEDFFPTPDELTIEQTDAISDALLRFMNENICDWVASIPPKLRYISLIGYLNVKAKFNGKDGLILIFENSKKRRKIDSWLDDLDWIEE